MLETQRSTAILPLSEDAIERIIMESIDKDEAKYREEKKEKPPHGKNRIRQSVELAYKKKKGVPSTQSLTPKEKAAIGKLEKSEKDYMARVLTREVQEETLRSALDCSLNDRHFLDEVHKGNKKRTVSNIQSKGKNGLLKMKTSKRSKNIPSSIVEYRREGDTMSRDQFRKEKGDSTKLGGFLDEAGDFRPKGNKIAAAHHIIASGSRRAFASRATMFKHKVRINDPVNGVYLPLNASTYKKYGFDTEQCHSTLHTVVYYTRVNNWIATSKSRLDLCQRLYRVKDLILQGLFLN